MRIRGIRKNFKHADADRAGQRGWKDFVNWHFIALMMTFIIGTYGYWTLILPYTAWIAVNILYTKMLLRISSFEGGSRKSMIDTLIRGRCEQIIPSDNVTPNWCECHDYPSNAHVNPENILKKRKKLR